MPPGWRPCRIQPRRQTNLAGDIAADAHEPAIRLWLDAEPVDALLAIVGGDLDLDAILA